MKRVTSLLLSVTILLCICGCKKETPKLTSPVAFYYRTVEMSYDGTSSVIGSELRESAGFNDNILLLLNAYFNGPTTDGLTSPFPRSLKAVNYSIIGATAFVQVSNDISQLKGIDLSIACACIASTVFDLNDTVERVKISSSGSYLDGSDSITIECNELYLLDTATVSSPETTESAATPIE